MNYWLLTNQAYEHWKRLILFAQKWPEHEGIQLEACKAQAEYVMFLAFDQWEINHGSRKIY